MQNAKTQALRTDRPELVEGVRRHCAGTRPVPARRLREYRPLASCWTRPSSEVHGGRLAGRLADHRALQHRVREEISWPPSSASAPDHRQLRLVSQPGGLQHAHPQAGRPRDQARRRSHRRGGGLSDHGQPHPPVRRRAGVLWMWTA